MDGLELGRGRLAGLAIVILLGGCSWSPPWAGPPAPGEGYRLHILESEWNYSPQSPTAVQVVLAEADLDHDALTIEPRDITSYDWSGRQTFDSSSAWEAGAESHQSMTLTAEATARLAAWCPDWRKAICLQSYFVVTLDGRRLYGGAVWGRSSQVTRPFPVIVTNSTGDLAVLQVFPGEMPGSARFDLAEVRDYFKSLGKLTE